ncbi:InsB [Shigella sonnei]|nr:InsB [Shigella sonnei]
MLGGADNPNGELPSYITGADNEFGVEVIPQRSQWVTQRIVTGYQIKSLSNVHKKIRKQVSVSGFLHSHWIGQLILN